MDGGKNDEIGVHECEVMNGFGEGGLGKIYGGGDGMWCDRLERVEINGRGDVGIRKFLGFGEDWGRKKGDLGGR